MSTNFIIMTAAAKMPNSCWGRYRKVAVLEVTGEGPKIITARAKCVRRIVKIWDRMHAGSHGGNSAYDRACREAVKMVKDLTAAQQQLTQ